MYEKYAKLEKALFKLEQILVMIPFVVIFITVVIQVVQRFFNLPLPDTTDMSIFGQACFTFFCIGMLVYLDGHITIEVHKMIKNRSVLFVIEIIKNILTLVFAAVFIYLGWDLFFYAFQGGSATMAMRLPLWIPYGSMLIGLVLMVVHCIDETIKLCYRKKHNLPFTDEVDVESMR